MLATWVGLAGLITMAILACWMVLMITKANANTDFVDFIYRISGARAKATCSKWREPRGASAVQ